MESSLGLPHSINSRRTSLQQDRRALVEKALARFRTSGNSTEHDGSYVYMNTPRSHSPASRSPEPSFPRSRDSKSVKSLPRKGEFTVASGVQSHRYILKTLKKAYEIEKKATPKPLQFQEFQSRFEKNRRTRGEEVDLTLTSVKEARVEREESRYVTSREIELKCTQNMHRAWLRRRRNPRKEQTHIVQEWVKSLHSLLDPQDSGKVRGSVLVGQLLALGLAHDPQDIIQIMLAIYGESEIEKLEISLEEMLELTKVDRETNRFLNFLSERIQSSGSRNAASLTPLQSWKEHRHTLPDYLAQIAKLWRSVITPGGKVAETKKLAEMLFELKLFNTFVDARRALSKFKEKVTLEEFQSLFSKSIFVGSLVTLAMKLLPMNFTVSSKMLISKYQRRLLMAGMQGPKQGIDHESGLATLKAVEKYDTSQSPSDSDYSRLYTYGLSAK